MKRAKKAPADGTELEVTADGSGTALPPIGDPGEERTAPGIDAAQSTNDALPAQWRSRVVRLEMVDPATLIPHPDNPKIHTDTQMLMLDGAIRTLGWLKPVLASIHTRRLVNGHLRRDYALREKTPAIPCLWLDITEEEELQLLAVLDPIRDMANADPGRMRTLLADVKRLAPTWNTAPIRPFDPVTDSRTGTNPVASNAYLTIETTGEEQVLDAFIAHVRAEYPTLTNVGSRMMAWIRDHASQVQELT